MVSALAVVEQVSGGVPGSGGEYLGIWPRHPSAGEVWPFCEVAHIIYDKPALVNSRQNDEDIPTHIASIYRIKYFWLSQRLDEEMIFASNIYTLETLKLLL